MIFSLSQQWKGEGGGREVLVLAFPLILSTGSWAVQHFVDRMFLSWYSAEAIAAAMPAGLLNFAVMSFFIGTASYVGTFVAQYYGAGIKDRIGPAVWQGVYLSLAGGVILLAMIPLAGPIFTLVDHESAILRQEVIYFQYLCLGGFPVIAASALSGFFTGLGRPWPVMWVNVLATGVNLILDYGMIFGHFGFPEMGIKGAAIASVIAGVSSFVVYMVLIIRPGLNRTYGTLSGWRPDRELLGRLVRFGVPAGVQFFLDMAGFTAFVLFVGRLGTVNLAATNIAFNINTLAFMPMIGFGIAVSVLVGQYIGKDRTDLASRSTYSGFLMTFVYMSLIALLYLFLPGLFTAPFAARSEAALFPEIKRLTETLLRFVALYSIFDTMNIIFSSALKGAGDTRFVMVMIVGLSGGVLAFPTWLAITVLGLGVMTAWTLATTYVILLGFAFYFRFLRGKWKSMRVIEVPPHIPNVPAVSVECPDAKFEP
ncbi:MAG: MATE family efflux transporter [Thermodesulfobacteriota bacterium]